MVTIPAFSHTPIDKIKAAHDRVTKSFFAHKTRSLEWRLQQLRKLYWGFVAIE
jgi:beta-apo-4'-carotenal oxygenase